MDSITVKNFRCFGEQQTVPLAPLTLLVGDNSTGKTSFLALVMALWDVANLNLAPDLKEYAFDLGTFLDIVHKSHDNGDISHIEAGFTANHGFPFAFETTIVNRDGVPFPYRRRVQGDDVWVEVYEDWVNEKSTVEYGTAGESFRQQIEGVYRSLGLVLQPMFTAAAIADMERTGRSDYWTTPEPPRVFTEFISATQRRNSRPYASAPIRSLPVRTYDPTAISTDPEGLHTPSFLARKSLHGGDEWEELQNGLIDFGKASGLFDDFKIKHLGKTENSPFQIHVRKRGKRRRGEYRNLIDMGYGISQALPILAEMLRVDSPEMFLLQQPEIHLHPSAQAELGTLFCKMAASDKQIIVETHSEYVVDRIRMDIRDRKTSLGHQDVSVLYFERGENDVGIHPIRFDEMGNVMNAPEGYGKFFMDEVNRSLGI